MKRKIGLMLVLGALTAAPAVAGTLVNVDEKGLALQGFDPVAFFTQGRPMAGDPAIQVTHEGASYRFATAENRAAFQKEPAKYLPAYGGYCAFGVAFGGLYPVQIETWQILDGRLVLNKTPEVKAMFDKDRKGNLAKADANWPELVKSRGAKGE